MFDVEPLHTLSSDLWIEIDKTLIFARWNTKIFYINALTQ